MSTSAERISVADRPDRSQYEIALDGAQVGRLSYGLESAVITHRHTEIDAAVGGRGLGSALVRFALDDARARKLSVVPRCPFVASFIVRHPEYEELVA